MIDRFFTTAATIETPSTAGGGSAVDSEGVPTVTTTSTETLCHVQPYRVGGQDHGETSLGREEARRARRAWFPAGTAISFDSTVVIDSVRYRVAGDPGNWQVGSSADHVATILIRQLTPGEVTA